MRFSSARPRPASNFELYSWFFMRISAIVMFLMVGFHLFYMHLIKGVDAIDFALIAQRWESPFWRLYDLIMLTFAWLHCVNGVRVILDDYVRHPGLRVLVKSVLYVFGFALIVMGAYVALTFKP